MLFIELASVTASTTFSNRNARVGNEENAAGANQRILPTSGFPAPIVPVDPEAVTTKVEPTAPMAVISVSRGLFAAALMVSATFLNENVQPYELVALAKSGRLLQTLTSCDWATLVEADALRRKYTV